MIRLIKFHRQTNSDLFMNFLIIPRPLSLTLILIVYRYTVSVFFSLNNRQIVRTVAFGSSQALIVDYRRV